MADYRLYCFAQSGNAYKAALMLALTGAQWEPVFVDFFNGETRSADYRRNVNAMGEVPVLVDGTERLSQSGVILNHLCAKTGLFGGTDARENREILRWILFDNHKFTSYLATYRFLHAFAPSAEPAVMAFLLGRIRASVAILDQHLGQHDFIAAPHATIADLSLCGYLYYPAVEFGFDITKDHPAIAAWLDRIAALPGWTHPYELMPGHPLPSTR